MGEPNRQPAQCGCVEGQVSHLVIDNLADWRQGTYTSRIAKDLPAGGK